MKNVWIVDNYILESRTVIGSLTDAIIKSGATLYQTKYIPFANSDEQDYGNFDPKTDPVILYGVHGFLQKCKIPFVPGAYGLVEEMNCNHYYANIPSNWLLNENYFYWPFIKVKRSYEDIFEMFDDDKFFIRPISGFKTFPGQVLKRENIEFELNSTQKLTSVNDETVVMIAPVQKLDSEYRFVVGNKEVIAGSQYLRDGILDVRSDYSKEAKALANMMAHHEWQPDTVYTCDVALVNDLPKIIELNSFACAGLYACDKDDVVNSVNEIALKDFNGEL